MVFFAGFGSLSVPPRALPCEFKSALPSIEEIEKELTEIKGDYGRKRK
jgi:hypothetical protein